MDSRESQTLPNITIVVAKYFYSVYFFNIIIYESGKFSFTTK